MENAYYTYPQQFWARQQHLILHEGFKTRLQVIEDDMHISTPQNPDTGSDHHSVDVRQSQRYQTDCSKSSTGSQSPIESWEQFAI